MIRLIFHQIWNQRRQNIWIWLELVVLSMFIWIVVDPLFTMVCIKHVPANFDRDRLYIVTPAYARSGPHYRAEADNDSCYKLQLQLLLTQLNAHPMTEAVCIIQDQWNFPGGESSNGAFFYPDTTAERKTLEACDGDYNKMKMYATHAQWYVCQYCEGLEQWTDMPYTLGLRDAVTGEYLHASPDGAKQGICYISAKTARLIYGTEQAKGNNLYAAGNGGNMRVGGVYGDIKHFDYDTPYPTVILSQYNTWRTPKDFVALVRLKPHVEGADFEKSILGDVLQQCRMGNTLRFELSSVKQKTELLSEGAGANTVVRLNMALGGFGLLCVFLGVTGLFWVRCTGRRQDMGVMRSMGATRQGVVCQMLCESVLLFVLAFVPAMLLMGIKVYLKGYDCGINDNLNPDYWFLRLVPHVSVVTLISLALMLLVILLATWIPVYRASRTLPSDALRDE